MTIVHIAEEWRALAEAKSRSLREVAIGTSARSGFVGTPSAVADELVCTVDLPLRHSRTRANANRR